MSQLGSVAYSRPRKFREKLECWLHLIRTMWPECPALIDKNGTGLYIDQAIIFQKFGGGGGSAAVLRPPSLEGSQAPSSLSEASLMPYAGSITSQLLTRAT